MNWNWGKSIAAIVTFFILFCLSIIYITYQNQATLVSSNYYNDELNYDEQRARLSNGMQYKSDFSVRYDNENEKVFIQFPKLNQAIRGEIQFYKPANSSIDFVVPININTLSMQIVPLKRSISSGFWRLKILWYSDSQTYYNEIMVDL